jgi:Second Longin domain of FUZ, MON1 and HPS1/First Longin domain of FUZ, MON1 and HPS1
MENRPHMIPDGRDDWRCSTGAPNFIVMSDFGKPIFSTLNDTSTAQICGILHAIETSTRQCDEDVSRDNFQSVRSDCLRMVFMRVQAITLIAVSTSKREKGDCLLETESYLRLQIEYLYSQIVFTLSDRVQTMLMEHCDVQAMLLPSALQSFVRDAGLYEGCHPASIMTAGIQAVFPLSSVVRQQTSMLLKRIGDDTVNMVAALLVVGKKVVTLIQSPYRPHQLQNSDLQLLLHFIDRQAAHPDRELWLPLCFPRLHSSSFLHCYACCLDATTKLTLCLVSTCGSMEQFQTLRNASASLRCCLNIEIETRNVIQALSVNGNQLEDKIKGTGNDAPWQVADSFIDHDYEVIPPFQAAVSADHYKVGDADILGQLVPELTQISKDLEAATLAKYLEVGVLHFIFRVDIPILIENTNPNGKDQGQGQHPGQLMQCICPPLDSSARFSEASSQRRVWCMYQKLQLQLRLGSGNTEGLSNAFHRITMGASSEKRIRPTIGQYCPAMALVESPPSLEGVAYELDGQEAFLAMNGRGFELYVFHCYNNFFAQFYNILSNSLFVDIPFEAIFV